MSGMEELVSQHEETKNQLAELKPRIELNKKGLVYQRDTRKRNDVSHLSNDDLEDFLISAARMQQIKDLDFVQHSQKAKIKQGMPVTIG